MNHNYMKLHYHPYASSVVALESLHADDSVHPHKPQDIGHHLKPNKITTKNEHDQSPKSESIELLSNTHEPSSLLFNNYKHFDLSP